MGFNIHKYDDVTFDKNSLTNKRIKAFLLWFEYEVYDKNIIPSAQVILMDRWILKLIKEEFYEVVPFFKEKRGDIIRRPIKIKKNDIESIPESIDDKSTQPIERVSFLTRVMNKIKIIFSKKL